MHFGTDQGGAFKTSALAELISFPICLAAAEPIGGVNGSVPLHPDDNPPDFNERKRKGERKPSRGNPSENNGNKPPDPEHQIDEYA